MATREDIRETTQTGYVAPETRYMPRIPKEASALVCQLGYRIAFIEGDEVKVEPLQDGVLRYPPVQVGVPRDQDFIEEYTHMGPSTFSDPSGT